MTSKNLLLLIAMVASTTFGTTANANLRAPTMIEPGPSAALEAPKSGPTVKAEDLRIDCEGPGEACRVVARYDLTADEPLTFSTAFIVPSQVDVVVKVAGKVVETEGSRSVPTESRYELRRADQVVSIPFSASIPSGDSEIEVSYAQPVSRLEVGYGYFSDGRMVDSIAYELWPLASWQRAREFTLTWAVSMRRPDPSWWASTFGTVRSFACRGDDVSLASPKQQGDRIVARGSWGNEFPERLVCTLDDDDKL